MKKALVAVIVVLSFFLLVPAFAADVWVKGSTITVAWEPPTTYEDGSPIVGETIRYKLYIKNDKTGVETQIAETSNASFTIIVPGRAWWRFGVQATIDPDVSAIAWSSDPVYCAGGDTFGLRYLFPGAVQNLRRQ